jgi:uncharacterized damage-inducible protein DinB
MNKEALLGQRGYFKMVHGVTLRLIGSFADADLDYRPKPEMRSVRDLVLHIYGMQKAFGEGAREGRLTRSRTNAFPKPKPEKQRPRN